MHKIVFIAALAVSSAAFASQSSVSPFSSKDIDVTVSVQSPLNLLDSDGKAAVLGTNGALLLTTENASTLTPDQLSNRDVTRVNFSYDDQTKKSSMTLMTRGALLDPGSDREVNFTLPQEIVIDNDGLPSGIDHISSSGTISGQQVDLAINMTAPGNWTPFSHDGTQACSFVRYETVCDAYGPDWHGYPHPHCHVIAITVIGVQNYHVQGETKTDGYTVNLGPSAQLNFNLDYSNRSETYGPCFVRQ